MSDIKKAVLAYSGGLDTSVILKWLQDTYKCEVVTFTADLGQGVVIRLVSATAFVATKLEAFASRGGGDFLSSHDLEDVLNIVDGREELASEMRMAPPELRAAVKSLALGTLEEEIGAVLVDGQIAVFVGDYRLEQIHKPRKHQTQRQLQQIQPAAVFAVYNHLRSDKKTVDHKRHVTQIHSCALADCVGYGHNC